MKVLIILVAVINLVLCIPVHDQNAFDNPPYVMVEIAPGLYVQASLPGTPIYQANVSDIKIFFHSKTTDNRGIEVDLTNPDTLGNTDFSTAKDSIFLVHGWHSNAMSSVNTVVTQAYLEVQDVNIFVVDWSSVAKEFYNVAQANVEPVGQVVGGLVKNLVDGGLSLEKTVVIGHSLGAHVAGVIGATLGGMVKYVVGLDPAGPSFTMDNKENRIDTSDAKFVQIIHTNAGTFGWNETLGHADYWPNGGDGQAGCGSFDIHCNHGRSVTYFAESVKTGKFISKRCSDWPSYKNGDCIDGKSSYMGQAVLDESASGNYYLETNDKSPFAKG